MRYLCRCSLKATEAPCMNYRDGTWLAWAPSDLTDDMQWARGDAVAVPTDIRVDSNPGLLLLSSHSSICLLYQWTPNWFRRNWVQWFHAPFESVKNQALRWIVLRLLLRQLVDWTSLPRIRSQWLTFMNILTHIWISGRADWSVWYLACQLGIFASNVYTVIPALSRVCAGVFVGDVPSALCCLSCCDSRSVLQNNWAQQCTHSKKVNAWWWPYAPKHVLEHFLNNFFSKV
jgi:hypothetical protein